MIMKAKNQKKRLLFVVNSAVIAALYATLTLAFAPISFGIVQFRIAEALTVLPYFTPAAIPGLYIGCLIANIFSGNIFDIIFGSLATLFAAILSYLLRKHKFLLTLPPVIVNSAVIPLILKFTYPEFSNSAVWLVILSVGIGEALSVMLVGYILLLALSKRSFRL